jgi:hypothetical protein
MRKLRAGGQGGLKPILRKGFTTPDNVQKKRAVFIVNYEVYLRKKSHGKSNKKPLNWGKYFFLVAYLLRKVSGDKDHSLLIDYFSC